MELKVEITEVEITEDQLAEALLAAQHRMALTVLGGGRIKWDANSTHYIARVALRLIRNCPYG